MELSRWTCTRNPAVQQAALSQGAPNKIEARILADIHGPPPSEFIGFGDIHGPKPYEFIGFDGGGDLTRSNALFRFPDDRFQAPRKPPTESNIRRNRWPQLHTAC